MDSINEKFGSGGGGGGGGGVSGGGGVKGWADIEEEQPKKPPTMEDQRMAKIKRKTEVSSYAECYPG